MISEALDERLEAMRLELLQVRNADGNSSAFNQLCDLVNELRLVLKALNRRGSNQ